MKSFAFFLIFSVSGILTIEAYINVNGCQMTLTSGDKPNTVITNRQLLNCTEASIFWSYPLNNLTIEFSAPKSKPFSLCLLKSSQIYQDIPVYRIVGSKETLVTKSEKKVCMTSDRNVNKLTLKFVGPNILKYYGVYINFSIN